MMTRAGDPSVLRRLNIARVLRQLYTEAEPAGGSTVTQIAKATGLSRPTAEEAVATLIERGWLVETLPQPEPDATGRRQAGRPARSIRFDSQAGCVLGVDIARHWARALVADLRGEIIGRAVYPVEVNAAVELRLAATGTAISEALRLADFTPDRILAAGVATVGIVDGDGHVARSLIPGFTGLNLAARLQPEIPAPIWFVNDMRAAVHGEHWVGAAVGCHSSVYLHAGRRLGTAFLIDGTSPLGFHGAAGELPPQSGRRLIKAYHKLIRFTGVQLDGLTDEDVLAIDPLRVFEAAVSGNDEARDAVAAFAEQSAAAIEGLVVTVDPEVVILGGGIIAAGEIAAPILRSKLAAACIFGPEVVVSTLGEAAAAIGAVRLGLNQLEESLFADPTRPAPGVELAR